MERLCLAAILLFVVTLKTIAQTGGEKLFHLNKLPAQDTLLSGWKVQASDNLLWAQPGFDDSKWRAADPAEDITRFTPIHQTGICWIRLHISVDSTLAKQQLTAWVFQYSASQIYLDGKLIKSYGTIGQKYTDTKAFFPNGDFFALPITSGTDHVISVRLAYQPGLPYTSPYFTPLSAFAMYVNDYHQSFVNYQQTQDFVSWAALISSFFTGIFAIVALTYLFHFLFDRKQKLLLYYCLFATSLLSLAFCFTLFVGNVQSVTVQMWIAFTQIVGFFLSSVFLMVTIYSLFGHHGRGVFKVLLLIGAMSIGYELTSDITGEIIATNVYMAVCYLEGVRITIGATKKKKNGSFFILVGLIMSIICIVFSGLLPQNTLFSVVVGWLAILGFPLSMAIYLGIQNAITNQNLLSSLNKVQILSDQKQQILAEQNNMLELRVTEQTAELSKSLTELRSTQSQLIQKEKMASLGELTAGIAHEIQNPLNFVNNFSEVNIEMLDEMETELKAGNLEEAMAIGIDIRENEEKILQHGKRADFIIKGMLQHSRAGTGERQPTDINVLADEFFKLSYQGLRANDKSFNAGISTRFDPNLPMINVVQQDIGRVLLNLFNNAFYAVNQKQKTVWADYKPEVSVTTMVENGYVVVKVKDNGNGIPDAIKDKIMQPFFTTKPTGEGTGLGLSLSYDIVVKGHDGNIAVVTKVNEFTEFIITLPFI